MPLVIPNAFISGNPIVAADIEANNEAIKKYLNGGITAADVSPTATIKTQHMIVTGKLKA
jgi:hypothetical protein